jgi:hypothetical protein
MHLIQILLPLRGDGESSSKLFLEVREELAARFGGLTFYRNAPAEGLWKDGADMEEDAIVVAEVMADELDRDWWLATGPNWSVASSRTRSSSAPCLRSVCRSGCE